MFSRYAVHEAIVPGTAHSDGLFKEIGDNAEVNEYVNQVSVYVTGRSNEVE